MEPSLRSILHSMWPQWEQGRIEPPAYSRRLGWDERPVIIRLEQEASRATPHDDEHTASRPLFFYLVHITVSRLDGD